MSEVLTTTCACRCICCGGCELRFLTCFALQQVLCFGYRCGGGTTSDQAKEHTITHPVHIVLSHNTGFQLHPPPLLVQPVVFKEEGRGLGVEVLDLRLMVNVRKTQCEKESAQLLHPTHANPLTPVTHRRIMNDRHDMLLDQTTHTSTLVRFQALPPMPPSFPPTLCFAAKPMSTIWSSPRSVSPRSSLNSSSCKEGVTEIGHCCPDHAASWKHSSLHVLGSILSSEQTMNRRTQ